MRRRDFLKLPALLGVPYVGIGSATIDDMLIGDAYYMPDEVRIVLSDKSIYYDLIAKYGGDEQLIRRVATNIEYGILKKFDISTPLGRASFSLWVDEDDYSRVVISDHLFIHDTLILRGDSWG